MAEKCQYTVTSLQYLFPCPNQETLTSGNQELGWLSERDGWISWGATASYRSSLGSNPDSRHPAKIIQKQYDMRKGEWPYALQPTKKYTKIKNFCAVSLHATIFQTALLCSSHLEFAVSSTEYRVIYICKEIYINDRENVFLTINNYIFLMSNSSAFNIYIPRKCFFFLSHISVRIGSRFTMLLDQALQKLVRASNLYSTKLQIAGVSIRECRKNL